jgi:hypothetical protein
MDGMAGPRARAANGNPEEVITDGEEEGCQEEGHEEEGCEEEEVRKTIWTWHVLWGLVGCTRRPIPDC